MEIANSTHRRDWRLAFLITALAVLGTAWIVASRVPPTSSNAPDPREVARAGFLAPRMQTVLLSGDEFDLAALRGKVVVLNFWATWCAPCRAEMPALQALHRRRKGDGLEVIGVNQLESPAEIVPFIDTYGLSFPIALDLEGAWSKRYSVRGLPTTFFVNRQGLIRDVVIGGPMDSALLESKVDALLRE